MQGDMQLVRRLAGADRGLAVVSVVRPDGGVHASVVNAGVLESPLAGGEVVGMVVRGGARKLDHLRRTGRVTVTFRHGFEWVSAEGAVALIGPDDPLPGFAPDQLPELLRAVFRAAGGTHGDWDEYDRVMREERRVAVLVRPHRILTNG